MRGLLLPTSTIVGILEGSHLDVFITSCENISTLFFPPFVLARLAVQSIFTAGRRRFSSRFSSHLNKTISPGPARLLKDKSKPRKSAKEKKRGEKRFSHLASCCFSSQPLSVSFRVGKTITCPEQDG